MTTAQRLAFAAGERRDLGRPAAAMGNFDGVHRGHQAVVAQARAAAMAAGRPLAAITFEPHPARWFRPEAAPFLLQTPDQRARAMAALGVDHVIEVRFDADLAALSDAEFARLVLAQGLGVAHLCIGDDFRFGRGRMGDVRSLARLGDALGFTVHALEAVHGAGSQTRISSSAVRQALADGRPETAAALLGRPFAIEGSVIEGAKRGRTIAFPTANVALGAYCRPAFGVYAVEVDVGDGVRRAGVANLGVKPTVGAREPLLESHVFGFEGDLYGRPIEVALIAFLRPERRFDSFEALTRQISEDAAAARALLSVAP